VRLTKSEARTRKSAQSANPEKAVHCAASANFAGLRLPRCYLRLTTKELAMPDTLIENATLNSHYGGPTRHFRFGVERNTNEIVEVAGERDKDKEARTATARTLWISSLDNHEGFGRWAFVEVPDPYDDVVTLIRAAMAQHAATVEQGDPP
jgi:hypothetical protein